MRFAFESSDPTAAATAGEHDEEERSGTPSRLFAAEPESAPAASFDAPFLELDSDRLALDTFAADSTHEPPAPVAERTADGPAGGSAKAFGARQMVLVGGGMLAAGALIVTMLGVPGSASHEPAPSNPAPAPAPAPRAAAPRRAPVATPAETPAAEAPHWSPSTKGRWVAGNRRTAAFEVDAIARVHVWTRDVTPVLVVRCDSGHPEAFVYTQSAARMEPQDGDHTVTVAFDGGAPTTERWPDSDEHDALFARQPLAFTRQLTAARTLHFGFTPHNAAPVVATFALDGLEPLLQASAKQCGWKRSE